MGKVIISDRVANSKQSSTVKIADMATRYREAGEKVIDFSAGRAFEPTPKYIIDEAVRAMRDGDTHQTMAKGTSIYREAITKRLKRDFNIDADPDKEVIATGGVKQAMNISFLAILNPGDEVIVEDPCFVTYQQIIQYMGGVSVSVPLRAENNFRWDKAELEKAITPKTKAILFNTPHNPTGTVHAESDLEVIASIAKKYNLVVLSDEVYDTVTWGGRTHLSISKLPGMKERTITMTSLTKSFSMGGWRIGYVYADETIVSALEKLQQHLITSCNSFVQAAAAVAFGNPPGETILAYWKEWEAKCNYVTAEINKIGGLSCKMPEGGFYAWINIKELGISSKEFVERLIQEEKVTLVHGSSFGETGEGYVRMTCVKTYDDINEGLKRIKRFVNIVK